MEKVNLINPPSLELFNPSTYPHLGLLYLGAALKHDGFECEYVDLSDKKEYEIPEADYHLITVLYATYNSALEVRNLIKNGMIIIGGVHATLFPEQTFFDFKPHALITGEADKIIGGVLKNKKNGIIHSQLIENLNEIPFPDRDLISREKLRNLSQIPIRKYSGDGASTVILSSRGCPYSCSFCCKFPQNSIIRERSPENVFDEMVYVREKYKITHFRFWDECFTLNKKRILKLCKLLKEEDFYWLCISRVDTIDEELSHEMYDAGCREIEFGIESGSQKILNDMNKGTTVEQNVKAIKNAKSAGIKIRALMMEEYPTETNVDINLSKKLLIETQPEIVSLFSFVAHPGSKDYIKYGRNSIERRYFYPKTDSAFKTWIKNDMWKK